MTAALLDAPAPDVFCAMPIPVPRPQSGLTSTHLLAGAGGDTLGLFEAGYKPLYAANHDACCLDSHMRNWAETGTRHHLADVATLAMGELPGSDVLWASVICTEISPAGRRIRHAGPMRYDPDGRPLGSKRFARTRATALDVTRAIEYHRYRAVVVENVNDFVNRWELFHWWVIGIILLGYRVQLVSVSAAHIADAENPAAAQDRNRVYVVFTRLDVPQPDLAPRPEAWCRTCRATVRGVQVWRRAAAARRYRVGSHGASYDYLCPSRCGTVVAPHVRPAAEVFDLTDLGEALADKPRPPKASTTDRLEAALHYLRTDETRRHGPRSTRPDAARRLAVLEYRKNLTAASAWEPLTTLSAQGYHHAIVAAPDGWEPGQRLTINDLTYRMIRAREVARAQRLPDSYILSGTPGQVRAQAGNAVAANVARWIGERLAEVLL